MCTPIKIYRTQWFTRYARREGISDENLSDVVDLIEAGRVDAFLGSGLIKQRVSRQGEGKSGGYRVFLYYLSMKRAIFVFGFAKNEQDNLTRSELKGYRKLAKEMLARTDDEMEILVQRDVLVEVKKHEAK